MAKKPKAKEAAAEQAEHEAAPVEENAPEVISYKLSPTEALSRLRDMDFAVLNDDDRRSIILEIKGLLAELVAAQESLRHLLEERLWLLQTWDNVTQLRVASVKAEAPLPPLSMNVTRYFDEKKLEAVALAEKARIEAEEAAAKAAKEEAEKKAAEEAKAKAAAEAEAAAANPESKENQEHTAPHAEPHAEPEVAPEPDPAPESETSEEAIAAHPSEETAPAEDMITHADDQEMLVSDTATESIEPALALDPNEEGYVKLRLIEATEFDNIRLPPNINIEIKHEHAEELVRKDSARPLPADTPLGTEPDKAK
jgi:hypothetical protein